MFNKAILMGRICNDLEVKQTQTGVEVLSFRLAIDRSYQAKGEERKSDFFNIVAWRSSAEFIAKYFEKGRMILVEGELQTRQYTDKNGSKQNVVELIVDKAKFTGENKSSTSTTNYNSSSAPQPTQQPAPQLASQGGDLPFAADGGTGATEDDDYPF